MRFGKEKCAKILGLAISSLTLLSFNTALARSQSAVADSSTQQDNVVSIDGKPVKTPHHKPWSVPREKVKGLPTPARYDGPHAHTDPRGPIYQPVVRVFDEDMRPRPRPLTPEPALIGKKVTDIRAPVVAAQPIQVATLPTPDYTAQIEEANRQNEKFVQSLTPPVQDSTPWTTFIRSIYFSRAHEFSPGDEFGVIANSVYYKRGFDGKVDLHELSTLRGTLIGHTQTYLYFQRDARTIVKVDLRDDLAVIEEKLKYDAFPAGYPSFKVEDGDIGNVSIWGDSLYVTVNGKGIIRYVEKPENLPVPHLPSGKREVTIVDRGGRINIGRNLFAENGSHFVRDSEGEGLVLVESSGIYRYSFSTGRLERFMSSKSLSNKSDIQVLAVSGDRIVIRARYGNGNYQVAEPAIFILMMTQSYNEKHDQILHDKNVTSVELKENFLYLTKGPEVSVYDINHPMPQLIREFAIKDDSGKPVVIESCQLIGTEFVSSDVNGQVLPTPMSGDLLPTEGASLRCGIRMSDLTIHESAESLQAQFQHLGEDYAAELHRRGTVPGAIHDEWTTPRGPMGHVSVSSGARRLNWSKVQTELENPSSF